MFYKNKITETKGDFDKYCKKFSFAAINLSAVYNGKSKCKTWKTTRKCACHLYGLATSPREERERDGPANRGLPPPRSDNNTDTRTNKHSTYALITWVCVRRNAPSKKIRCSHVLNIMRLRRTVCNIFPRLWPPVAGGDDASVSA